jgi:hypothetical protein
MAAAGEAIFAHPDARRQRRHCEPKAKQSRMPVPQLDCFVADAPRDDDHGAVIASEAKQSRTAVSHLDCFVAYAPRNDDGPMSTLESPPPPPQDPGPRSLAELEARFARDLELLTLPPAKEWLEPQVHPEWGPMLDVAIVGAGMAGLAAAFALKCLGVRSMRLLDRAPQGFEGPWATHARMEVLRSPPELTGPAFHFANLTFRAWFEAQFGRAARETLHRIPRLQWMDYLRWYRTMIAVPIENETELIDLAGDAGAVRLTLRSAAGVRQVAARRLVLASGRDGLGGPYVPPMFRRLDRRLWAHTSDAVDYAALRGKTVAVIGAGASAADAAAEALEAGAARATMLVRRADVPRINKAWASAASASGSASTA